MEDNLENGENEEEGISKMSIIPIGSLLEMIGDKYILWLSTTGDEHRMHGFTLISLCLNLINNKGVADEQWFDKFEKIQLLTEILDEPESVGYKMAINAINAKQDTLIGQLSMALHSMGYLPMEKAEERIKGTTHGVEWMYRIPPPKRRKISLSEDEEEEEEGKEEEY